MDFLKRLKLNWYDDRETKRLIEGGEYTFSSLPIAILDLGAHKGFATEHFAKKYPKARIHAYEPNPVMFKALVRRVAKYPNVRCFNEAIAHDGTVNFGVSERAVSSSIFFEGDEVPSVSLRTAVSRIARPVHIKMDIEGAEYIACQSIPKEVVEIVGEVHPEKAGKTLDDFRPLFKTITFSGEGKCIFRGI